MITTRDIARAAAVAQSTVSRALRNDPKIALETRQRVQEVATSLGYRPNPVVSAFMSARRATKAVDQRYVMAYLTTDHTRGAWESVHTYMDFYKGAAERAAAYGFELQEFWLREPRMTGERMSQILYYRNIRGVLVAPLRSDSLGTKAGMGHLSLDWQRFAAASIGYTMMRPRVHRASHNHLHGIRVALRQLKKLGYSRPGLVLHAAHDARVDHTWSTAFSDHLLSQLPSARTVPFIRQTHQYNIPEFVRWFRQQRPDVIIAGSWKIFPWLKEAGVRVPDDVGFVILDLVETDAVPAMAGINQNSRAVAAAAVDLIVGQIHRNEQGLPECPKLTLIEGAWADGVTVRKLQGNPNQPKRRITSKTAP